MLSGTKITVIDQEGIHYFLIDNVLRSCGFTGFIDSINTIDAGISSLDNALPDMLIIDFFQNEQDRFRLLQRLDEIVSEPKPSLVVLWDFDFSHVELLHIMFPVDLFIHKPFRYEDGLLCIEELQKKH